MLIESVNFIVDNCYFTVGGSVFKQNIGVLIGIDCGSYIVNLTLFYYENKFLENTCRFKYFIGS